MADIKITGRALSSGWLDGLEDRKRKAVNALLDVVETSSDEEMRVKAFTALVRADMADQKRQEVSLKRQAIEDDRKLRLLELAKSLPAGVIARLTARDEAFTDCGPEGEGQ